MRRGRAHHAGFFVANTAPPVNRGLMCLQNVTMDLNTGWGWNDTQTESIALWMFHQSSKGAPFTTCL